MSEQMIQATAAVESRLWRDGVTVDADEIARLIELAPLALDWVHQISGSEFRYAEPALTHPLP